MRGLFIIGGASDIIGKGHARGRKHKKGNIKGENHV
jgi:hypothetical protein